MIRTLPRKFKISFSGCPNNCAQSATAQIGLVGMIRTIDGRPTPHYRLFTGGGNGQSDRIATPSNVLAADDLPHAIQTLLR